MNESEQAIVAAQERAACAARLTLSRSDVLRMVGRIGAQEMRTVMAVLSVVASLIKRRTEVYPFSSPEEARAAERASCVALMRLERQEIRLMAGELTTSEMDAVLCVLNSVANRLIPQVSEPLRNDVLRPDGQR